MIDNGSSFTAASAMHKSRHWHEIALAFVCGGIEEKLINLAVALLVRSSINGGLAEIKGYKNPINTLHRDPNNASSSPPPLLLCLSFMPDFMIY